MSDIIAPPSAAENQLAEAARGWKLSPEARANMWAAMKVPGTNKLNLDRGFNAAFTTEIRRMLPSLLAVEIERIVKEAAEAEKTIPIRIPKTGVPKTARMKRRPNYEIVELPITRVLLYDILLGMPKHQVPPEGWLDEIKAEEINHPLILGADGAALKLVRSTDAETEREGTGRSNRSEAVEDNEDSGVPGATGRAALEGREADSQGHQSDDLRHAGGEAEQETREGDGGQDG